MDLENITGVGNMKKITVLLLPLVVLSLSLTGYGQLVAPGVDNTPKVGQRPPDFELAKGLGSKETFGMKDFAGKKVLLAFFPAAFTAG
jgi:hypothetical protein